MRPHAGSVTDDDDDDNNRRQTTTNASQQNNTCPLGGPVTTHNVKVYIQQKEEMLTT